MFNLTFSTLPRDYTIRANLVIMARDSKDITVVSCVHALVSPKTCRVEVLMHIKSVEASSSPFGGVCKFGSGWQLRSRSRQSTLVQNYDYCHQYPLCCFILRLK
ncbi:hypothetical protein TNCT_240711 [Trichonephila clavata]|uniref:Uncharacterized protein n=1 Tax=Trichonephila clavata TaxID=2740835 RepID=A0A8X6LYR1_TRICU|nr:hypothetical protein TNCT_240711 [Trichonephila clavata]